MARASRREFQKMNLQSAHKAKALVRGSGRACWAACLGDCSEKMSREHPISRSMFEGDEILVQGYPWCRETPQKTSVANLTRKVLCRKHNSDLSDIDKAGGDARKSFSQAVRSSAFHGALPTVGGCHTAFLDGFKFERWCLKALISLSFQGERPIGKNASGPGQVDEEIVRLAFGQSKFHSGSGLYSIGSVGEKFSCSPSIRIGPFVSDEDYIFGGLFIILNFRFALMLEEMNAQRLNIIRDGKSLMGTSEICYRPLKMGVAIEGVPWVFNFEWHETSSQTELPMPVEKGARK
jgi:hypothetical protein